MTVVFRRRIKLNFGFDFINLTGWLENAKKKKHGGELSSENIDGNFSYSHFIYNMFLTQNTYVRIGHAGNQLRRPMFSSGQLQADMIMMFLIFVPIFNSVIGLRCDETAV